LSKILITGASGFIGASLARRVSGKGNETHVFIRRGSDTWRLKDVLGNLAVHPVDLADRGAVFAAVKQISPGVVYHFAAYGGRAGQADAEKIVSANLFGSINLVDACAKEGVPKFVNAGTSSEYGVKEKPMRETDSLEPNSAYSVAKAAATLYCMHMARDAGLPAAALRIFAAYGPYEEPGRLVPTVVSACLRNVSPRLASPDSVRDFIFVGDVLDAFETASREKKAVGEILNVGTGKEHSVRDVVEEVRGITGSKAKPVWGAVRERQPEPRAWVADMGKAEKVLGWKPRRNLREGLAETVSWFKKNLGHYA
jgi:nucleoside-diphosphate-sugar epimerase